MKKVFGVVLMLAFAFGPQAGADVFANANFSDWTDTNKLNMWSGRGLEKELAITINGNTSAKLTGVDSQIATGIKLRKNTYYRIKAWIYKGGSNSYGCVGLRDKSYTWKLKLDGSKETGTWKEVSAVYKADGTERYFYCFNWYIGKQEACYYSSLSMEELTADEAKMELAKK